MKYVDDETRSIRRKDDSQSNNAPKKKLTNKEQIEISKRNRPIMDRITEIADELISKGLSGIYGMTFESISASTVLWEYKGLDNVVYGPYTSEQIAGWKSQGYLTGETAVMVRRLKPRTQQTVFSTDIYGDDMEDTQPAKKIKTEQPDSNGKEPYSYFFPFFILFCVLDRGRMDQ